MAGKSARQVFCIDDDPEMLELIKMLVESMGNFNAHLYTDARTAIKAMRDTTPDLVLLDVEMPEMNGITLYRTLREMNKLREVPVIFVTGRKRSEDMEQYKALGVPFIKKPFDLAQFQLAIGALYEHSPARIIAEKMQGLRKNYVKRLKESVKRLERLLAVCGQGTLSAEDRAELKSLAHNLSGTGATYGFDSISECGHRLESAIGDNPAAEGELFMAPLRDLIEACKASF